jgi:hypothetical protein
LKNGSRIGSINFERKCSEMERDVRDIMRMVISIGIKFNMPNRLFLRE